MTKLNICDSDEQVTIKTDLFLYRLSGKHVSAMSTPFKPHFYIVKLGYAGVYLFFLFLLQNIDYGYSLPRGGSNV